MSTKKIKLRGGLLANLNTITLDEREVGVTTDTFEIYIGKGGNNVNLTEKNRVYTPFNYGDKASGVPHFTRLSGSGTVAYEDANSVMGRGCYRFTNDASYLINRFYPVAPNFGIGGHVAYNGLCVFQIGVEFYDANYTLLSATAAQRNFLVNSITGTSSYAFANAILVGEGTAANQMPVGTRFIKPRIQIASNATGARVDAFIIYPNSFALRALYA